MTPEERGRVRLVLVDALSAVVIPVGLFVVSIAAVVLTMCPGLERVFYQQLGTDGVPVNPFVSWKWLGLLMLGAVCLTSREAQLWRRWNNVQFRGGLWMLGSSALGVLMVPSLSFVFPEDECARAGCWPAHLQEFLCAGPAFLGAVAMIVMSFQLSRPWWVRAAVPAVVIAVAGLFQVLLWPGVILPFLSSRG